MLLLFFTSIIIFLMAVGFGCAFAQLALQLSGRVHKREAIKTNLAAEKQHFLSLHIPTYSEPPGIVIATLRAILAQNYDRYEVVVIDNNTKDESLWKPVEDFCRLHPQLKFIHVDRLSGFKAGALNVARRMTDPAACYLVTIDADYQLLPGALQTINTSIEKADDSTALLQFPQAYRNVGDTHFNLEYRHFFDVYLDSTLTSGTTLGTGTLSCVNLTALDQAGGWPTSSITEDAALGETFRARDWHGTFINVVIGEGLIPTDVSSHFKQRARWIYGNAQVLASLAKPSRWRVSRSSLLQLSAWANPLGFCFVANILLALGHIFNVVATRGVWEVLLIGYVVFGIGKLFVFKRAPGTTMRGAGGALMIHLNYLWLGAFCWLGVLFKQEKPFVRTCKSGSDSRIVDLPWVLPFGSLATSLLVLNSLPIVGSAFLILAILLGFSRVYYFRQIKRLSADQPKIAQLTQSPQLL